MEEIIRFEYIEEKVAEALLNMHAYYLHEPGLSQCNRKRFLGFALKIF